MAPCHLLRAPAMGKLASVHLKPQIQPKFRRLGLSGSIPSIPTKLRSEINFTKAPDLITKQRFSAPVSLRRPNQHSRLESSNDSIDATVPSSSNSANNLPSDVLRLMDSLQLELDEELYLSLIKECTNARDATQAAIVHAHILKHHKDPLPLLLTNRLLLMHAACGDIETAGNLFDEMPVKDTLSWVILMSAYSELPDGHHKVAKLFVEMLIQQSKGKYYLHAMISTLRSCARSGSIRFGLQIHALMIKLIGLPEALSGNLGCALVQFYCAVDCHDTALQVFDEIRRFNLETIGLSVWSSAMTSCNRDSRFEEAILLFIQMAMSGKRRDSNSLSRALTACAGIRRNGSTGKQIHADAIKHGLGSEPFVVTSLVHMYSNHGLLTEAGRSFDAIERPDDVCWNAMLVSCTRHGLFEEAVKVLYKMKAAGVQPTEDMINEVKMACMS